MSRLPLLSVVLYIATRLWIEGHAVDESIVPLLARAGITPGDSTLPRP